MKSWSEPRSCLSVSFLLPPTTVQDQCFSSAPRGSGHKQPGPEHLTTYNAAGLLAGLWGFAFSLYPSYLHGLADPLWFHSLVPLMPHRVSHRAHLYSASTSFLWLRWSEDMDKRSVFMQMTCRFMWSLFLIILSLLLFYQFVLRTWRRRCHFFSWSAFKTPKTQILIIGFRHWLKYTSSFSRSDEYDNSYHGWLGQRTVYPFSAQHLWQSRIASVLIPSLQLHQLQTWKFRFI